MLSGFIEPRATLSQRPSFLEIVYPGHDYNGRVSSTIGEEKTFNERLNLSISKHAFVEMMNNRHVPPPAKMEIAIPANMRAGRSLDSSPNRRSTLRVP